MRILWLPLTLLLASPSTAADKTVFIRLHYVPAIEVDRGLARGALGSGVSVSDIIAPENRSLVPSGITAWTVDERRNGLSVTGNEEGIRSLQQIIDLIDVPARHVRLSVRVVRLDDRDMARLKAEPLYPSRPGRKPTDFVAAVTGAQAASLEARDALAAAEMSVANNLPLHLAWPYSPNQHPEPVEVLPRPLHLALPGNLNQQPEPVEVLPRVNGDGTVTLFLPRSGILSARTPGAGETLVIRRVAPGHGVVIFSRTLGTALMVNVREVLPPGAEKGQ